MNLTCNSTLEHLRINPGSEIELVGSLTFHDLARIIGAGCTLIATVVSLYLIWMHALHYTKPKEQRYIIRILFMVPVYAISSFLQIQYYWHAIYFQVLSDCYEAFAIASFFALLCHYVAPDLHLQKEFFREMRPIKPWVMPINWFAKCCGGQRGPWRTPKSGLTWFNISWIGVYHYCFIRVAMTISAVVSQYFDRYCESSNSPVFGHIWIIVLNAAAVTIAMFCLIQFYVQLKDALKEHKLFIKIVAIKLVVFLSFWQNSAISVGTSTLKIVHPNKVLAYPDLKVGVPALLLCIEMALFALLHIWAFPYKPYEIGAPRTFYPSPDLVKGSPSIENIQEPPSGGFLGFAAIWDSMNIWDFVKAFGRGMRWLFCGVKRRKEDISYQNAGGVDMDHLHEHERKPSNQSTSYDSVRPSANMANHPASQRYDMGNPYGAAAPPVRPSRDGAVGIAMTGDESIGLMQHAQPNPEGRRDPDSSQENLSYPESGQHQQQQQQQSNSYEPPRPSTYGFHRPQPPSTYGQGAGYQSQYQGQQQHHQPPPHVPEEQGVIGQALWGPPQR